MPRYRLDFMRQHALQTALTLYESGTYTLELAARQAGIEETRLRDGLARRGLAAGDGVETVGERHRLTAD